MGATFGCEAFLLHQDQLQLEFCACPYYSTVLCSLIGWKWQQIRAALLQHYFTVLPFVVAKATVGVLC